MHMKYVSYMAKMIHLRRVPDALHRKLKARAAMEGLSLSGYLVREFRRSAGQPTMAELEERLARRMAAKLAVPPARAVREERDRR
jgi:plasmid stability protein